MDEKRSSRILSAWDYQFALTINERNVRMEKNALVTTKTAALMASTSIFFDVEKFEHAQRIAKVFAGSTMVPEHFRNNIGNIMIAIEYAQRVDADIFHDHAIALCRQWSTRDRRKACHIFD
jgi:hypothetical protein